MTHTERQRQKILELLYSNVYNGINSKLFYNNGIYRYSQRLQELRKIGYEFASRKEPINGGDFFRFWIITDPYKKYSNPIPTGARLWGKKRGVRITKEEYTRTQTKYRFEGDWAIPIITEQTSPAIVS